MRTANTLIRLGGCPGCSESSLGTQPHYWFCPVAAQITPFSFYRCIQYCMLHYRVTDEVYEPKLHSMTHLLSNECFIALKGTQILFLSDKQSLFYTLQCAEINL